jgi:drug/metabolite transporter (DMT)-like permease
MLALLALASSVCWGTSDFFAGLKSRTIAPPAVVAFTQSFALLALSVILLVRHTGFSPSFSGLGPWWAIVAGLAGAAGLVCFYSALASGTMGVVAPIASLGSLVPVLLGLVNGEHPSAIAWVGMAIAVLGAAMASGPELTGEVPPRPVFLAVAAAMFFGIALFSIDRGARYAILETLWTMRMTTAIPFLVIALVVRSVGGTRVRDFPALAAIGLGDVTANALFALSSSRGMVSVASVLGSLYPVATLFWARVLLGERLRRVQSIGVGLTLAGVVAIAL